ncbi:MAG: hypothetical protein VCE75_01190 [Alphaproteobacteria bacterium]
MAPAPALLAFVPSSLLLGVTQHITTDVASVPLLWVVPLIQHDPGDQDNCYFATSWVAIPRQDNRLAPLAENGRWKAMMSRPGRRVWTDDYGNLLSVTRTWRGLLGVYSED